MRYIFKNIKTSLKTNILISVLYTVCTAAAVLAVLFSHGVYQNYSTDTYISEISADQEQAYYSFGEKLDRIENEGTVSYVGGGKGTVGEFRRVLDLLDDETKESFTGFFLSYSLKQYGMAEWMNGRLEYHTEDHRYGLYREYLDNTRVTYGRYFTEDEDFSGARVAVIRNYPIGENPAPEVSVGDKITLFGAEYEVVGMWSESDAGSDDLAVPFASLPDDMPIKGVHFLEGKVITTKAFRAVNEAMKQVFGDNVNIPEMETADVTETKFYASIVMISVALSAVAAITLMILFRYIVFTRRKTISVLRLAGCTRGRAAVMFIAEAVGVSVLIFGLCAAAYHFLLLPRLTYFFPKITEVYTPQTYLYIFGVFTGVLLLTMTVMVLTQLDRQPVDMFRRAGAK
ncbi:hypothetical protein SAMN02910317_02739 [Ruminococcaceae bacterium FB2012]|nr:hypothetical protein SAMN02910317_02739 [Ruminococcaceae bacterium FB2012]